MVVSPMMTAVGAMEVVWVEAAVPVSAVIDAVAVVMAPAGDSRPLAQLKAVSAAAKIAAQTATDPALPSISWHCWRRATRRPDGQCGFWHRLHCCPHCFQPQAMARLPLLPGLPALPSLVYASHPPPTAARWCAAFRCCHGFRLSWWIVRMDAPADRRRPCHGPDQSARSTCTALARGWSEHTERACGQAAPLRAHEVAKKSLVDRVLSGVQIRGRYETWVTRPHTRTP